MDKMGKSLGKLEEIYGYYGKIIGNYAFYIGKSQKKGQFFGDHSGQSVGTQNGILFYDIHIGIRLEHMGKYWENNMGK